VKLYIGNATRQVQHFAYVVPELGPRVQEIPIGGQTVLSDDLSSAQIDAIVKQHVRYGLVQASEIDARTPFVGVCYSVDRPISEKHLQIAMDYNMRRLVAQGRETRKLAAITQHNILERTVARDDLANLASMEVTIQEDNHDGRDPRPAIADGIILDRAAPSEGPAPRPRRSRRAA
jgi:hypothetical protein